MTDATFNYPAWRQLYPVLASRGVNPVTGQNLFGLASGILDPASATSAVQSDTLRQSLMDLLVAHLAQLMYGEGSDPKAVGQINSASEGSVSVNLSELGKTSPSGEWFNQTQYGATFWRLTSRFRSALYIPGPVRNMNPWRGFGRIY